MNEIAPDVALTGMCTTSRTSTDFLISDQGITILTLVRQRLCHCQCKISDQHLDELSFQDIPI